MDNKTNNKKVILIFGLIGILAALLTIISDLILLGKPGVGYSFFVLKTESTVNIAQWRITGGTFLGVIALPFQIVGAISMYYCFKPSGRIMPKVMSILNVHALIMGVAFHMSYAFLGWGWKVNYKMGSSNKMAAAIVEKFDFYWKTLIIIMLAELLVSSSIYCILIIKGKTLYPKWMAATNIFFILLIMFPLIYIVPAPIGGYIAPTYLNLSTLILFCISTVVIYKRFRQQRIKQIML